VVPEKNGEDHSNRWSEKRRTITKSQERMEYPTYNKKKEVDWIGHILCRNCLLTRVVEGERQGRIEVTGRRGRIRKQLLDDLKDEIGYWN
jgi:hypothetical protein